MRNIAVFRGDPHTAAPTFRRGEKRCATSRRCTIVQRSWTCSTGAEAPVGVAETGGDVHFAKQNASDIEQRLDAESPLDGMRMVSFILVALLAFASFSFAESTQKELGYIVNARANPSYAGSVSGSGGGYTYGKFVFLQAKENMGWSFSNWVSKNGNCPLSVDSRGNAAVRLTPSSGYACSVEAVFKRDKVSDMVRKIGNSIAKKLPKVVGLPVKTTPKKTATADNTKTSTTAGGSGGGGSSGSTASSGGSSTGGGTGGGGIGGCFLPGTPVQTPHGDIAIEKLVPGDSVYSFSEDGTVRVSRVSGTHKVVRDRYFEISTASGTVSATAEHPFYTGPAYKEAQSLSPGDTVFILKDGALLAEKVISAIEIMQPTDAYNLQVDAYHTFFAGGFAVHNKATANCNGCDAVDDGTGGGGGKEEDGGGGGGDEDDGKSDSDSSGAPAEVQTTVNTLADGDGSLQAFIMELFGIDADRYKK